jgi:serine/threonine-protein kinase RsbW
MNDLYKEIRINSALINLFKVEKFVEEICDAYYITNSYFGNILISVGEAVKNAIIHGNKEVEKKIVRICFRRIQNGLSFTIIDEGKGFDFHSVPNPVEIQNESANSANGIFLIRSLSDKVCYNLKGNQIEIEFHISSINQETTLNRINRLSQYFKTQQSVAKPTQ